MVGHLETNVFVKILCERFESMFRSSFSYSEYPRFSLALVGFIGCIFLYLFWQDSRLKTKKAQEAKFSFSQICSKKWKNPLRCSDRLKRYHKACFRRTFAITHRKGAPSRFEFDKGRYLKCLFITPLVFDENLKAQRLKEERQRRELFLP